MQDPDTSHNRGAAVPAPPQPKPSRKRRATTARAPRQLDPGVQAIRQEAAAKVRDYHKAKASAGVLKRIVEKELGRLTKEHQAELLKELQEIVHLHPIPK